MAVPVVVLVMVVSVLRATNDKLEKKWKEASENVKSYGEQFSKAEKSNRAFKLTVDQLKASSDSIFQELDRTRKELKIKDSKLKSMLHVSSDFVRSDTIILKDTLFRGNSVDIDTLLSDGWYSVRVALRYPSSVMVRPEFRSVKNVAVSTRRETVNPPKRFFLLRWFQKRHTVVNVDIVERNPYIRSQDSRYVEIVE